MTRIERLAGARRRIRIALMADSAFSVGDRVARLNDGAIGVVEDIGPMGGIDVRWESSGVMSVVVPAQIRRV
jgi:hypothetical protein